MSKGLLTVWAQHLKTEKERQDFMDLVRNSTQVLGRLKTIIEEGSKSQHKKILTDDFLANPNWPNAMAFELGKEARDQHMLKLLEFLD